MRYLRGPESLKEYFVKPEPPGNSPEQVRFIFLGTNTLYIEDDSARILIDPNFTRPCIGKWVGRLPSSREHISDNLQAAGIETLDAVLLTHTHFDHALDAVETVKLSGAVLAGSASACNIGRGAGLPAEKMFCGLPRARTQIGKFYTAIFKRKTYALAALFWRTCFLGGEIQKPLHPPASVFSYKSGQVLHILLQHPQGSLLCLGSAGCFNREPEAIACRCHSVWVLAD